MDWKDPDSTWARAMRRRARVEYAKLAASILIAAAAAVVFPLPAFRTRVFGFSPVTTVLFILMLVIAIGANLLRYRRTRRTARLVPLCNGLVCPHCRVALEQSSAQATCPRCGRRYPAAPLRAYWENHPSQPLVPFGSDSEKPPAVAEHLMKRRGACACAIWLAMIGALVVWISTFAPGPWYANVLDSLPFVLWTAFFSAGMALLSQKRTRIGTEPRCARCEYLKAPQGNDVLSRCPECGNLWNLPGGSVHGRLPSRRYRRPIGVALVLLGTVPLLGPLVHLPWSLPLLHITPTRVLISQAVYGLTSRREAWAELMRRQLSPAQQTTLATRLLDKRLERNYLDPNAGNWLWKTLRSGALPERIKDRYFMEMFEARLEAPATAQTGKRFRVRLVPAFRRSSLPVGVDERVYVGGFQIGDAPERVGRRANIDYASLLDNEQYLVETWITPERPGPLRIKLDLWLVVGTNVPYKITWQADGSPLIPAGVFYARHLTPEVTVTAKP